MTEGKKVRGVKLDITEILLTITLSCVFLMGVCIILGQNDPAMNFPVWFGVILSIVSGAAAIYSSYEVAWIVMESDVTIPPEDIIEVDTTTTVVYNKELYKFNTVGANVVIKDNKVKAWRYYNFRDKELKLTLVADSEEKSGIA